MTAAHTKRIATLRKTLKPGVGGLPSVGIREDLIAEGSEGLAVLLGVEHPKWKATVVELGAKGCPWPAGTPLEVATRALGPLAAKLPDTLAMLGKAKLVCAANHTPHKDSPDLGGWFLIYALARARLFLAGPPSANPICKVAGWEFPAALRELQAHHDGFGFFCGEFGWSDVDPGIQPSPLIAAPKLPDGATDLLRIARGSSGVGEGGWCFQRDGEIVDLDRTFARGAVVPHSFWGFLDRYLTDGTLPLAETD